MGGRQCGLNESRKNGEKPKTFSKILDWMKLSGEDSVPLSFGALVLRIKPTSSLPVLQTPILCYEIPGKLRMSSPDTPHSAAETPFSFLFLIATAALTHPPPPAPLLLPC